MINIVGLVALLSGMGAVVLSFTSKPKAWVHASAIAAIALGVLSQSVPGLLSAVLGIVAIILVFVLPKRPKD